MSACTVWALILAAAAIVATVFAYRYRRLANRIKHGRGFISGMHP